MSRTLDILSIVFTVLAFVSLAAVIVLSTNDFSFTQTFIGPVSLGIPVFFGIAFTTALFND